MTSSHGRGVPLLLLIEGRSADRPTTHEALRNAQGVLQVECVTTVAEGLSALRNHDVSAVLLDLSLPECRDLSAVDELRRVAPKVAILALARATDQALARRAVDRGASDYVVTDQLDSRTSLELIAMMFERRAVDEQKFLERERAEVTLNSIGDAVMTTDFKHINDTLGHAVGDQILKSISRRVESAVRDSDTVSRHGGDEFIILLSEVDQAEDAALIARKIIAAVAEPHRVAEHELTLTASIGISVYPEDGPDAQTLIARADIAMYHAKSSGRNQVGFYRSDMEVPTAKRLSLEAELRNAVDAEEFVLHYQPTICLETGAISGAEALMRWNHPSRGLVQPDDFIPAAEASALIVLKIDQSFVHEIAPFPEGAPLVRAVIAMGKSLGCRIVAEGVETRAQLAYLRAESCDEGQGYHFSPAVDADALG